MRISFSMLFGLAVVAGLSVPTAAFADGDAAKGAKIFKKCAACHTATEAKNKIGPHLDNVIDRPIASIEDFKYSKAMTEHAEETPTWTVEALTEFLHKPTKVVKGTKMSFAGLKKDKDIEDILAYLKDPSAAE
ncbi:MULTISPECIES: c-type cytochrome [unclassified Hoeflea]|jgi:cytochrome c|uniref:c-type cytochrome n=1 Tax=unclassified Hoeflea TaxID=2614931 RepID=UPI0039900552